MANIGYYTLLVAWFVALYAGITAVLGAQKQRRDLKESSERGILVLAYLIFTASAILVLALMTKDFSFRYVADHTSLTLHPFYALAAWWSGQAGSLLFWLFILMLYTIAAVLYIRRRNQPFLPYIIATIAATSFFFLTLLHFFSRHF